MSIFQSLILSIVEGVTEFLPISSTGHLILSNKLLFIKQSEFVKSFDIVIQLGAILAVVILYFDSLLKDIKVWKKILISFLPTAFIGLIFYEFIKSFLLGNSQITILMLFIGGIIMIVIEKQFNFNKNSVSSFNELTYKKAFILGVVQSISMIPGVSRAGATIYGALFMGLTRKKAVEFSFLLAIPTMMAASFLDIVKTRFSFTYSEYLIMTIGFIGAFFSALITIKYLLKFIKTNNFVVFGIYRILLAILFYLVIA